MDVPDELKRPGHEQVGSASFPPPLLRERPVRPPLVPRWVWIAAASALGVIVLAAILWAVFLMPKAVTVPDVTGVDKATALTRLKQVGLRMAVSDQRFSSQPEGEVLEQTPGAGGEAREGDVVQVVISAGIEDFPMPDVVGNGLNLALSTLKDKGLIVEVQAVTSDAASDTVLATVPSAGASVRSGDTVQVQVATPRPAISGVRPYDLTGLVIAIDPAPVATGRSDVPLDVTRRLRALFEASGATVTLTRSQGSTATADADRQRIAAATTATVGIGLTVQEAGAPGRQVITIPTHSDNVFIGRLVSVLSTATPPATAVAGGGDPVFASSPYLWARVILGSFSERADANSFANPNWSDEAARAIYSAVGEVFGK